MKKTLQNIWRLFSANLQWRLLWCSHSKFNVGTTAILLDQSGHVLLLKHVFRRNDEWGLPAGWMRSGESFEQAIIREVMEETSYIAVIQRILRIKSGFKLRVEVAMVGSIEPQVQSTNPKLSFELLDARFFSPHQLPSNINPHAKELIDYYSAQTKDKFTALDILHLSNIPKPKTEPNKSLEPTRMLVTDRAAHAPRQAPVRLI